MRKLGTGEACHARLGGLERIRQPTGYFAELARLGHSGCYLRPGRRCRVRMATVMAFAYPVGGMKLGGAMGRSRWIDTVWALV